MRFLNILFILFIVSCSTRSEQDTLRSDIAGSWLVMDPDHSPENKRQKKVYSGIHDSIELLNGLKLVNLLEDGTFQQMDSLHIKGKWGISPYNDIYIIGGGKGFDNFKTKLSGFEKDLLQLDEKLNIEGETLKVTWNLKKVDAPAFFEQKNNTWRQKPSQPESAEQMRKRLSQMLKYYSDYFKLVNKEADYFMPARIPLPLKYYQHAMGMGNYNRQSPFSHLFFDDTQSKQAYDLLEETIIALRDKFPSGKDFVDEYALFIELMSKEIVRDK